MYALLYGMFILPASPPFADVRLDRTSNGSRKDRCDYRILAGSREGARTPRTEGEDAGLSPGGGGNATGSGCWGDEDTHDGTMTFTISSISFFILFSVSLSFWCLVSCIALVFFVAVSTSLGSLDQPGSFPVLARALSPYRELTHLMILSPLRPQAFLIKVPSSPAVVMSATPLFSTPRSALDRPRKWKMHGYAMEGFHNVIGRRISGFTRRVSSRSSTVSCFGRHFISLECGVGVSFIRRLPTQV
jgi:hypothetical protein